MGSGGRTIVEDWPTAEVVPPTTPTAAVKSSNGKALGFGIGGLVIGLIVGGIFGVAEHPSPNSDGSNLITHGHRDRGGTHTRTGTNRDRHTISDGPATDHHSTFRGRGADVVGKDLQVAQDTMQSFGFYDLTSTKRKSDGRMQILDRGWQIC